MTNSLRIALKHIFESSVSEIVQNNYKVEWNDPLKKEKLRIYHLKFHGGSEVHICDWNLKSGIITVFQNKKIIFPELVFIMRTIETYGYKIEKIVLRKGDRSILIE